MEKIRLNKVNTFFIFAAHGLAVAAILWMALVQFSWWTIGLGLFWGACSSISVTGGYHRLFAHPTYKAAWPLRFFYAIFGAASVQNSAIKWSADHRVHHAETDHDDDPYNITKGFWWAHIGWVLFQAPEHKIDYTLVPDLTRDPLLVWQDKYYVWIAIAMGALIPFGIGFLWGDPIGAVLTAGFLRLVLQWHATFAVNSVAHTVGAQTYTNRDSARDSWITAFVTLGEGYHNFHHRFQGDYRNGFRWYHFDPTKWFVWTLSKVGVTRDLRRVPKSAIAKAREVAASQRAQRAG